MPWEICQRPSQVEEYKFFKTKCRSGFGKTEHIQAVALAPPACTAPLLALPPPAFAAPLFADVPTVGVAPLLFLFDFGEDMTAERECVVADFAE